jgi:hypothetical protein
VSNINRSQVTEFEVGKFWVDASELGWKPGQFPKVVQTDLGNGMDLIFERWSDVDFRVAQYSQVAGCIAVRVFND